MSCEALESFKCRSHVGHRRREPGELGLEPDLLVAARLATAALVVDDPRLAAGFLIVLQHLLQAGLLALFLPLGRQRWDQLLQQRFWPIDREPDVEVLFD